MSEKQSAIEKLSKSTAVTAAIALAEYASFWDLIEKADKEEGSENTLLQVQEMVREQALMLLLLARSMSEYGEYMGDLPKGQDPRILLPLIQEIGQSYAVVALALEAKEIQLELLLSPDRLDALLDGGVAEFISKYGEEEAVRILEERSAEAKQGLR
jgi:hypothetical protein